MLPVSELALVVFAVALVVVPVTLLVALFIVRRFRARVKRSMRSTSRVGGIVKPIPPAVHGSSGVLEIEVLTVTGERRRAAPPPSRLIETRRRARAVALTYAGAASILPLVLATVLAFTVPFAPTGHVVVEWAIFFVGLFLVNATPVTLAPTIVRTKQLPFQILAVFQLVAALCVLDWLTGGVLAQIWLMIYGVATAVVLFMSVRRLRAVGPIVFTATLLFFLCVLGGAFRAASLGRTVIGVRFVRDDLAQLSTADGAERFVREIAAMRGPERVAALSAMISQPTSVLRPLHPEALTTWVRVEIFAWVAGALVVGAVASFLFVHWLAVQYRSRRASDQMLSVDVLLGVFTLYSLVSLTAAFGWSVGASAIVAFGAYALCARVRLRRLQQSVPSVQPRTILFLRVFGFDRRTQRLLQDFGQRWRYIGPILLVGGADLANSTIEPHEFFEFLNGRLTRMFVTDLKDVERRLVNDGAVPDPDGLFRIQGFYCYEDTWRAAVAAVAPKVDVALMDLRGFSPENQGCVFEIEQLLASLSVRRIVLLIDRTSDLPFLERTLQDSWRTISAGSPNDAPGAHRLRVLRASWHHSRTVDVLMGLLCESMETQRTDSPPN
jgi:hypothetical protein